MQGVVIRIDGQFPECLSWARTGRDGELVVRSGTLAEAAKICENTRVTVLVPGEEVLLTTARVPGGNPKRVAQAAPFAIEDQLADEIENLHFVLGEKRGDDLYGVAVVARARMDYWLTTLEAAGIRPLAMVPLTLALPLPAGGWSVLIESGLALVRTGRQQGVAVDHENLASVLEATREEASLDEIVVELLDPAGQAPVELPAGITMHRSDAASRGREDEVLRVLAAQLSPPAFNLLQGDYQHRAEWLKVWQVWRPAALLAVAVLLLQTGLLAWGLLDLRGESRRLSAQIMEVYRSTFPDARETADPRGEMEQRLQKLLGGERLGGGFLELMGLVADELVKTKGYRLQTIKFKSGSLDLFLQVKDLESLDDLQARLRTRLGLAVEIKSALSKDGDVKARLLIEEKAP